MIAFVFVLAVIWMVAMDLRFRTPHSYPLALVLAAMVLMAANKHFEIARNRRK